MATDLVERKHERDVLLAAWCPPEWRKQLDEFAQLDRCSRSSIIRRSLEQYAKTRRERPAA